MIAARAHHGALTGAIRGIESMNKYPPTAEQFRTYFDKHKLTRRVVCEMVGVQMRAVSNWKNGSVVMPYAVWFTIRTKVEGTPPDTKHHE